jgi:hypothetical protein
MALWQKLQIKPGETLAVLGLPRGVDLALPADVTVVPDAATADAVLAFVASAAELDGARPAIAAARADRLAWIAYPKGGQLGTDLSRDRLANLVRRRRRSRCVRSRSTTPGRRCGFDQPEWAPPVAFDLRRRNKRRHYAQHYDHAERAERDLAIAVRGHVHERVRVPLPDRAPDQRVHHPRCGVKERPKDRRTADARTRTEGEPPHDHHDRHHVVHQDVDQRLVEPLGFVDLRQHRRVDDAGDDDPYERREADRTITRCSVSTAPWRSRRMRGRRAVEA